MLFHSARIRRGAWHRQRTEGLVIGKNYLELLMSRVGTKQDADHSKVKAVVECVIDACTARRRRDILGERIVDEFSMRAKHCLGERSP